MAKTYVENKSLIMWKWSLSTAVYLIYTVLIVPACRCLQNILELKQTLNMDFYTNIGITSALEISQVRVYLQQTVSFWLKIFIKLNLIDPSGLCVFKQHSSKPKYMVFN